MSEFRTKIQTEKLADGSTRYSIAANSGAAQHESTFTVKANDFASVGSNLLSFTQDVLKRKFLDQAKSEGATGEQLLELEKKLNEVIQEQRDESTAKRASIASTARVEKVYFRVQGIDKSSGREVIKHYRSIDESDALQRATADQLLADIDSVVKAPPDMEHYVETQQSLIRLKELRQVAGLGHVAIIMYDRPKNNIERLVEVYDLVGFEGFPPSSVRCWQVEPVENSSEDGWRTFRLDRILYVHDSGVEFNPRAQQHILTDAVMLHSQGPVLIGGLTGT